MRLPKIPLAQTVVQLCIAKGIKHIVISPGSRNAPLTIGFTNHPFFECYSIVDERSAAFVALGIAQQTQTPVAVVCTSGSALLNYYPAIAEAYYSDIPMVVLSADRPEHLINVGDGQTINQKGVYSGHILYEANLTEEGSKDDQREINNAINTCIEQQGPVHINIPFNEPLYELVEEFNTEISPVTTTPANWNEDVSAYKNIWRSAKRKLVLVGSNYPNSVAQKYLDILAKDDSVIVFTETTSNLNNDEFFPSIDKIIAPLDHNGFEQLQPEVLLTFGGMIVSKKIKAFLRKYQPKEHWHIDPKKAFDTFFCLKKHFKGSVNEVLGQLLDDQIIQQSDYKAHWSNIKLYRQTKHEEYLDRVEYSDLKVFQSLLNTLPNKALLHCGNSSTIRYMQLFHINSSLDVFCNRGTSGIDGSTSTAVGASMVSSQQTVFITGDLSFFYDSNALWNNYIPPSFRIIVINNSGGGIFRILPGHKNTTNFDTYFETKHDLKASHLCNMYGFQYSRADSIEEIEQEMKHFYKEGDQPKLLEIFTPRKVNDTVLLNYFEKLK